MAVALSSVMQDLRWQLRTRAPLLVWLAVLLLAMWLFVRQQPAAQLVAYASETVYTVAAVTSGRVSELYVGSEQHVDRGEIVAVLDDSELILRARAAQAELEQLRAELDRRRVLEGVVTGDALEQQRRFAEDRERAHVTYLRTLGEFEQSRVRAEGLGLEVARLEALSERGLVADSQLNRIRTDYNALSRWVQEQEPVLTELRERHEDAVNRHEELLRRTDRSTPAGDQLVAPFQWAMRVQEIELEQVALARSHLAMRAPAFGKVEAILARPGEYVRAGTALLTIVDTQPTELVAYLEGALQQRVVEGADVLVRRSSGGAEAPSTVLRRGARMVPMPLRDVPPGQPPRYGLPVIVALPADFTAVPGEPFSVRLRRR